MKKIKEKEFEDWYKHNYSWFIEQYDCTEIDREIKQRIESMKEHDLHVWKAAIGSVKVGNDRPSTK